MLNNLIAWFISMGASPEAALNYSRISGFIVIILLAILSYLIAQTYLLQLISSSVERTETKWDDALNQRAVFSKLANIAPAIVIIILTPLALGENQTWVPIISNLALIYIIIVGLLTVDAFLNGVLDMYRSLDWSKDFPIRGFLQVFKIIAVLVAILMIASIVLNQTVLYILGTLGAATAVLMLIFQDSILSLVAGIQLTANRMIARDDFITMPSFDAEGTVKDIALTTIRVQNTDKSITTIPTRSLISQSFKNWRGMSESGGRRIKRSISLDINTVKPFEEVDTPELQRLLALSGASSGNGRFESNVGAFRAYAFAIIEKHPHIHQEGFTKIVRELAPTETGLPIELYIFSSEMDWVSFEAIQADLFEHLIMVLPKFGLRIYQKAMGIDFLN
ncbi:MAG: mechanosensitive ion channel domain-containing protein [Chloroflexota bacterium]